MPPVEQRRSPIYPKQFTARVRGFLVMPMTIPTPDYPHVNVIQDGIFLYDYDRDALKVRYIPGIYAG
jgi:hypothetical protein